MEINRPGSRHENQRIERSEELLFMALAERSSMCRGLIISFTPGFSRVVSHIGERETV